MHTCWAPPPISQNQLVHLPHPVKLYYLSVKSPPTPTMTHLPLCLCLCLLPLSLLPSMHLPEKEMGFGAGVLGRRIAGGSIYLNATQ